jgi:cytochrome c553
MVAREVTMAGSGECKAKLTSHSIVEDETMRLNMWMAVIGLGGVLFSSQTAHALEGDPVNGKRLFMTKGPTGKACMTCHPKGLTTGEDFRGKDIPDLTEEVLSDGKVQKKTVKFLKYQKMSLSSKELADLVKFTSQLPTTGFGSVPPEWKSYVESKAR